MIENKNMKTVFELSPEMNKKLKMYKLIYNFQTIELATRSIVEEKLNKLNTEDILNLED